MWGGEYSKVPSLNRHLRLALINRHLIEIERCGVSTVVVIPVHVQHLMTCRIAKLITHSSSGYIPSLQIDIRSISKMTKLFIMSE